MTAIPPAFPFSLPPSLPPSLPIALRCLPGMWDRYAWIWQLNRRIRVSNFYWTQLGAYASRAVFTQRSLSDLTLDQSKVRSDKVCVNTLNRRGKPDW